MHNYEVGASEDFTNDYPFVEDIGHVGGCLTSFSYAPSASLLHLQCRHVTWALPIRCTSGSSKSSSSCRSCSRANYSVKFMLVAAVASPSDRFDSIAVVCS